MKLKRQFNRRHILKLSALGGILVGVWTVCRRLFWPAPVNIPEQSTFAAYLDTLIPEDETPSATQVGVAEKIMAKSKADPRYTQLIQEGCKWLDKQAGQYNAANFSTLSEAQRDTIVRLASEGHAGSLPLGFFGQTRQDAFFYYYAQSRSWPGLGYPGSPQPQGFPDYTSAPRKLRAPRKPQHG